jgi:hypothetical protein
LFSALKIASRYSVKGNSPGTGCAAAAAPLFCRLLTRAPTILI